MQKGRGESEEEVMEGREARRERGTKGERGKGKKGKGEGRKITEKTGKRDAKESSGGKSEERER